MIIPQASLMPDTRFKFQFVAGGSSNNLYIDDIQITGVTSLEENAEAGDRIEVMPNPADDETFLQLSVMESGQSRVTLTDLAGREVMLVLDGNLSAGNHRLMVNTSGLSSGMYLVNMNLNGKLLQQKLVVK
jgi:hypothetical protein